MHDHEWCLQLGTNLGQDLKQAAAMKMCAGRPLEECKTLMSMFGLLQPAAGSAAQPAAVSAAHPAETSSQQPTQRSQSNAESASTSRDQLPAPPAATPSQNIAARLSASDTPATARHGTVAVGLQI